MANSALIVDDDPAIRRFLAAVLKTEGFQVLEAADGAHALAALEQAAAPVAVIISDIQMAQVDGVALYEAARDKGATPPFVFITGHADSERMVSVPPEAPVLTKPFMPEALVACVRRVLSQGKQAATTSD